MRCPATRTVLKARHVVAQLGQDRLGRALGDPRNRVETGEFLGLGSRQLRDPAIVFLDLAVEELDVAQDVPEQ